MFIGLEDLTFLPDEENWSILNFVSNGKTMFEVSEKLRGRWNSLFNSTLKLWLNLNDSQIQ